MKNSSLLKRKIFILILSFASMISLYGSDLPNVVFILADDIGLGDIGLYHRERTGEKEVIPTPNLDRLASDGIRFDDAHTTAAYCAPSRYSIMTGNYTYRCRQPWGVWGAFEPSAVEQGQVTVAEVMKSAGYHTAFFGKWHLGGAWRNVASQELYVGPGKGNEEVDYYRMIDDYPNTLGFDYSCQLPAGIQNNPYMFYEDGKWMPLQEDSKIVHNTQPWGVNASATNMKDSHWKTSIVGSMLAQKTVDFIDRHLTVNTDIPFFIYYCSQAVHSPHDPPVTFHGDSVKGKTLSKHGDMIYELDMQVGMIIKALKEADQYKNTLFIFTSDNGGLQNEDTEATGHDSSNGFRGYKSLMYEGGHRVPFFASWPGKIPAGALSDEPVMVHDLMATMYALTGQVMPEGQAMDSYNLLPLLTGAEGAKGRDLMMLQGPGKQGQGNSNQWLVGIRLGDWKLIIETNNRESTQRDPFALFNLANNPTEDESENLIDAPEQQIRVQKMLNMYNGMRDGGERTTQVVK